MDDVLYMFNYCLLSIQLLFTDYYHFIEFITKEYYINFSYNFLRIHMMYSCSLRMMSAKFIINLLYCCDDVLVLVYKCCGIVML